MKISLAPLLGSAFLVAALFLPSPAAAGAEGEKELIVRREVIVQGQDISEAEEAIEAVGGVVSHKLKVIQAVGVRLTDDQIDELRSRAKGLKLRIYTDFPQVRVEGKNNS